MSPGDDEKRRRKCSKTVVCLASLCVFLLTLCVCLLTVLVLIGKFIGYNACNGNAYDNRAAKPRAEYWKLPNDTEPISYDLTLFPNLTSNAFEGVINITIAVSGSRRDVVLHSKDLIVSNVTLFDDSRESYRIVNVEKFEEFDVLVITTKRLITPGIYYLFIEFESNFSKSNKGFYLSTYKRRDGTIRKIATSKFEPTYARQAYPCFDEPNLKAKYKVHLLKPKDSSYIALSNFPQSDVSAYDDDNELVTFEETVSMSTYLSCFIVSDFAHTETSFENKGASTVPLKVYASPDNLEKTKYAGEVGKKCIEYYVDYFQIPYPLPKLDMVAIPDFVSGAMEHWGLVTYRETALLYTNTTHSSANKQRVASVVAHELAHSWFGNLVTMNWWNDLWLNEGFASYIQYKGVLAAEPDWGMLDQFLISTLHGVLSFDSTLSSHPIVQTVLTPDQITEIFDVISYNKGASILRMLENTVGEKNFQQGVKNYLNLHAYKNAVTKDFLDEIQKTISSAVDVKELMETFTAQTGYPILTASVSGNSYTFTQKRFLKDPSSVYNETDSKFRYKWSIPVTYVTNLGKSSSFALFKYNENSITIRKPEGAQWIKFNYDQIGYYRVNYPSSEWESLISHYKDLSVSDRTHLLEESFSIAEADQLNYKIPLDLTKKLIEEFDYTPWHVADSKLNALLKYLKGSNSEQESSFKRYIINITTPAYNRYTWNESESDTHLQRLARITVLSMACAAGHEACLAEARDKFDDWLKTGRAISPDLRGLVYSYGMKKANEDAWNKLLEMFKAETDASEKLKLVNGLASTENEELLKKLLEQTKDEDVIRSQDVFIVLQYISANPNGTELVWTWVRSNWKYLVDKFTLNDRNLGRLIPSITARFATEEKLAEMEAFFKENSEAGAGVASRASALETVRNNIAWLSKYKGTVEEWIKNSTV
ncbi:unnamed protein product [Phyllotreta striolata]|uniref:Aminopeptidase n=1 Tax=Phyllotreta striolata TaxID=444603 RepID=A0A9N9TY12_PHYSR|nr:unnamed protein product [Phyllotreta striolata]